MGKFKQELRGPVAKNVYVSRKIYVYVSNKIYVSNLVVITIVNSSLVQGTHVQG